MLRDSLGYGACLILQSDINYHNNPAVSPVVVIMVMLSSPGVGIVVVILSKDNTHILDAK